MNEDERGVSRQSQPVKYGCGYRTEFCTNPLRQPKNLAG